MAASLHFPDAMQHPGAASLIRVPVIAGADGPRFCQRTKPSGLDALRPGYNGNDRRKNFAFDVGTENPRSSCLRSRGSGGGNLPSAELKCQVEHNDAFYGDCEGRQ
jgi:hypothetical protein